MLQLQQPPGMHGVGAAAAGAFKAVQRLYGLFGLLRTILMDGNNTATATKNDSMVVKVSIP